MSVGPKQWQRRVTKGMRNVRVGGGLGTKDRMVNEDRGMEHWR